VLTRRRRADLETRDSTRLHAPVIHLRIHSRG